MLPYTAAGKGYILHGPLHSFAAKIPESQEGSGADPDQKDQNTARGISG